MDIIVGDVEEAAICFLRRKNRFDHPGGKISGKVWVPSAQESRVCCTKHSKPTLAFPWALQQHCRTAAHIAALFQVDAAALRRAAREIAPCPRFEERLQCPPRPVPQMADGKLFL